VDKVLTSVNHCLITNLLGQNIVGTEMSVNDENAQSPNVTQNPRGESLSQGVRTADSHGSHQEPMTAENQGFIPNGDAGYATVRAIKPTDTIGLEAVTKLIQRRKTRRHRSFLEKCEFAISCASETARTRLLQGIIV